MAYIRQRYTGSITVVVIGEAEAALQQYPELFEQVEGLAPENAEQLKFMATEEEYSL